MAPEVQRDFGLLVPAIAEAVARHSHLAAAVARLRRSVQPVEGFVPAGLSAIGERVAFLERHAAAAARAGEVLGALL